MLHLGDCPFPVTPGGREGNFHGQSFISLDVGTSPTFFWPLIYLDNYLANTSM